MFVRTHACLLQRHTSIVHRHLYTDRRGRMYAHEATIRDVERGHTAKGRMVQGASGGTRGRQRVGAWFHRPFPPPHHTLLSGHSFIVTLVTAPDPRGGGSASPHTVCGDVHCVLFFIRGLRPPVLNPVSCFSCTLRRKLMLPHTSNHLLDFGHGR